MVTSIRWGLVSIIVGLLVAGAPSATAIIGLAIIALSLDGVDGKLARRQRLESRFGAACDMEVDSVFALVLAALAALGPYARRRRSSSSLERSGDGDGAVIRSLFRGTTLAFTAPFAIG
ncbi:CDP-alcohol phosphatidyltransferase family protein [Microcella alkaliphila]|uniref:CDP-alcohol phosphatidyltransferase n=1 Tax=Microcella alkaliphila TaxID=279828 RepID=A0A0U5B7P2_9MICO|nr:CDP-alcohol phosphatidyltransferase family protein [Microcella alkaliphila]BAU31876.1 CDP-alcohol phosphatidyltransferase [Microcella alkaliphila]